MRIDYHLAERIVLVRLILRIHREILNEFEQRGQVCRMDTILRFLHTNQSGKGGIFKKNAKRKESKGPLRKTEGGKSKPVAFLDKEHEHLTDLVQFDRNALDAQA